jgi:hypothetical protein
MPNDVFRAIDAVLVMGVDDSSTPEGQAADALVAQYDFSNTVGRLQDVSVAVSSDVRAFYEIGRRYPTHLRPGIVRVAGSAKRAHVNGALLRLLLGDGAISPPASANFVQPSFNIIASLTNPARPGEFTKLTVFGVKFDAWSYHIPAEEFVMESITFQAMRVAFEEA